jgi:predicted Na+-dependent transporter
VVVAAAVGLSAPRPLAWAARHNGINLLLALLVLATAVGIDAGAFATLRASRWRLLGALVLGITVLPALSWAVAQVIPAGSLRDGMVVVGLAPCEIASVATTRMARGQPALSAVVLIGSTVLAVALAGPILALEVSGASVHPGHVISNLALVVALPLAAGIVLRAGWSPVRRAEPAANVVAIVALAVLVGMIAAQVHLGLDYLSVLGASILFLLATAAIGVALARHSPRSTAVALLLTMSMRDFAIAAGLASAAFGAAAAAPLGLYGVVVLVWGTAVAGALRSRSAGA